MLQTLHDSLQEYVMEISAGNVLQGTASSVQPGAVIEASNAIFGVPA